jgi:DNA-binding transcriptional LysR family regulator
MEWSERVGRRIKLRDLHVVLAVANCGSMAKAAEQLATSHPVVSKTIANLESNLGVRLFDRTFRGVELTSYGRALIDCSVAVFDEMKQGLKRIELLSQPETGELRIGCPEIVTAGLMPIILQKFSSHYPHIRLNVVHADVALLQFGELRERNVELLIGRIPGPVLDEDLTVEVLFEEPFVLVGSGQSRWSRLRKVKFADLAGEPWVLPPYDSVPGRRIADIFRANNVEPPRPSMITMSGHLTSALVASGHYLGLLPWSLVTENAMGLKPLTVRYQTQWISVGLITIKNRTLSPLADRFIACVRDIGRLLTTSTKGFKANSTMRGAAR